MNRSAAIVPARATNRVFRRLVLGTAFFLGLALALMPRSPSVHAQEPKGPPVTTPAAPKATPKSLSITNGRGAEIKIDVGDSGRASVTTTEPSPGARSDSGPRADEAGDDASSQRGEKPRKRARVTIDGIGTDREFDSFDEFVRDEPELAAMVVAVVTVVFFAPVLAIALILWYRMRKARMLNETMLKLAEKGIVSSADAIDALGGGKQPAAMAPYYEQAKQVRRESRMVRPAQGRADGRLRHRPVDVFPAQRPRAQWTRARAAVRRSGLRGALVVRAKAPRSANHVPQGGAPGPGAGTTPGSPPA